jgi:hypothetical protein
MNSSASSSRADVARAAAQLLKREGVKFLIAYPRNQLIESAAEAGIRTIIVRQERVGVRMADAVGCVTSGVTISVFALEQGRASRIPLAEGLKCSPSQDRFC